MENQTSNITRAILVSFILSGAASFANASPDDQEAQPAPVLGPVTTPSQHITMPDVGRLNDDVIGLRDIRVEFPKTESNQTWSLNPDWEHTQHPDQSFEVGEWSESREVFVGLSTETSSSAESRGPEFSRGFFPEGRYVEPLVPIAAANLRYTF